MASTPGTNEWLKQELGPINGSVTESGRGPEYDAFVSMYNLLPESNMVATVGGDLCLDFGTGGANMNVRPIASYGSAIVVRDLTEARSTQDMPVYYFFRGSIYTPEIQAGSHGSEAINQAASFLIEAGSGGVGVDVGEEGINIVYNPHTFCREGQLVYASAYPLEALRTRVIRNRSAAASINGMLITIQPVPNQPLTLFVEGSYKLTPRIKQVDHRIGSDFQSLLSFVPRPE